MPDLAPVSVVILTYNEEANIRDCLESVISWANEVYVLDSGSTDDTLAIVARYPVKVVSHPFLNYSQQRNWAQRNLPLSNDWVFHLDADERVSDELARSILNEFRTGVPTVDGFLINRRAVFLGRWIKHGGIYPTYHHRLYRVTKGVCEDREYDQHFKVNGAVSKLTGDIINHVTPNLAAWTLSHERWAAAEASEYFRQRNPEQSARDQVPARLFGSAVERRRWLRKRIYGILPLFFRPFLYFFVRYILRFGFMDGVQGLIFHILQGFWYRFYVDAKIWESRYHALDTVRNASADPSCSCVNKK